MPSIIDEFFFLKHYSEIKQMFVDREFKSVFIVVGRYGKICLYLNAVEDDFAKILEVQRDILALCNKSDVAANLEYAFLDVRPSFALNFDDWILLEAAKNGYLEVAKQSVTNGASINAKGVGEFFRDFTPMLLAAANNHVPIMTFLLEELEKKKDLTKADLLDAQDSRGTTPLHAAAFCGHQEAIKWLLENGARYDIKNEDGKVAEQVAVRAEITRLIKSFAKPADIITMQISFNHRIEQQEYEQITQALQGVLKGCTGITVYPGTLFDRSAEAAKKVTSIPSLPGPVTPTKT